MAKKQCVHQVTAGNNFDGSLPNGPPVTVTNRDTFPAQAGGGKFAIGGAGVKLEILDLVLDGVAEWKLELLDASDLVIREIGRTVEDAEGNPVPSTTAAITCNVPVGVGEKLKLTTTGATGAISSEIFYDDGQ